MNMAKGAKSKNREVELAVDESDGEVVRAAGEKRANLCILEVDAGLEEAVGSLYIDAALPSVNARKLDGRIVAPESGAWRIEEIDTEIIGPSNRVPMICNVIVVRSADTMTVAGRDRVLKTLEEPAARSSFCFLVRDRGALGPTILGRAGVVASIHSSDQAVVDHLLARGVSDDILASHGPYWSSYLGLLERVSDTAEVEALLLGADAWRASSVSAGTAIAKVIDRGSKDPAERRQARILAGAWMASVAASVRRRVAEMDVSSETAGAVLASLEGARENLAYNTPLPLVIARALAGRG
jgi:hypothetical protein